MLKLLPFVLLLAGCSSVNPGPTRASNPPIQPVPVQSEAVSPLPSAGSPTDELVLSKEVLAPTRSAAYEPVKIRKVITTHTESAVVPVRIESYEIVRFAPTTQVPDFTPKEIGTSLLRELPSVAVQAQVVEVVKLQKNVVTENRTVQAELRTESVEVVK